ncbi:MAG: glutathione S-transferase family protein [Proteobacteria bacterium]|nr:glutathione S-transferase family protein [Pseudomonadota bacterium]
MAELEIIGVPFSNYVRSVRMLCEEKGVAYKLTPSRPHTPEVTCISPAGQIPVMRHGDVALFESKAIATYIDKVFPGPKFIPEDAHGAALVEQWVSYGNVKVDRWIMREFVVPSAFFDKAKGPDTAKINAALPEIDKCAKVIDTAVAKTGYLVGSALTYADMNVLPMLATAMLYPAAKDVLAKHATLMGYVEKLSARPSFTNTAPPPRK